MKWIVEVTIDDKTGFCLAQMGGKSGEVSATPGEAVTSLLVAAGVEVNTGARVIPDTPTITLTLSVADYVAIQEALFFHGKHLFKNYDAERANHRFLLAETIKAAALKEVGKR